MLQFIRNTAGSWVVKILFILLIASFGVWGIGDVVRRSSAPSDVVAKVGPIDITRGELDQEFRRQMERLRPMLGGAISTEQALQLGLPTQAVSTLAQRTLYDLAAKHAGLVVSNDTIRQRIADEPAFRAPNGQFDRNRFATVLREIGLSEQGYAALMRREIARGVIASSIGAGVAPPKPLVEALYRRREEKRVAEVISIPNASVKGVDTPDEAAQLRYYEDHQARFTAPEYRALTSFELTKDAVAKDIEISDEQIRAAYAERASDYIVPERRTIAMVLVSDEATATAIADAARAGAPLADAAKTHGAEAMTLDNIRKAELPEVGEDAFALAPGAISAPIKSPLGWHVLAPLSVQPAFEKSLDEVRQPLLAQLKLEAADNQIYKVSNQVGDQLAGGATLEEVAQSRGLTIAKIAAVDGTGKAPDGSPVTGGVEQEQMVQAAFALAQGGSSNIVEGKNGGYFAVRVDLVTPATPRPLAEVQGEVIAGWQEDERARKAAEQAKAIADALKADGEASAQAVATAVGADFAVTDPFTRTARNVTGLTPDLIARLFEEKPGDVVIGNADSAIQRVARLRDIIAADPTAKDANLTTVEQSVARGLESDLMNQFAQALQKEYPITVYQDRIAQIYAASP